VGRFGGTVCKTVRPMLSERCLSCLSCPVCDVGVLWPNGWTDQDETWHAGRPRPWPQCVRWGLWGLATRENVEIYLNADEIFNMQMKFLTFSQYTKQRFDQHDILPMSAP